MRKDKVSVDWKHDLSFNVGVANHLVALDGDKEGGLCPKPLMLASLAGCTAFDVVAILRDENIEFQNLHVTAEGELGKESPRIYTHVHLVYQFKGSQLNVDGITRAVKLSVEEQCGVLKMFKSFATFSYEIEFE